MNKKPKIRIALLTFSTSTIVISTVVTTAWKFATNNSNLTKNSHLNLFLSEKTSEFNDLISNLGVKNLGKIPFFVHFGDLRNKKGNFEYKNKESIFAINKKWLSELKTKNETIDYQKLNNSRENAIKIIENLDKLSPKLGVQFVKVVNFLSNTNLIDYILKLAKLSNEVSENLLNSIVEAETIKENPKYLSATNYEEFDAKLASAKKWFSSGKLVLNYEKFSLDLQLENLQNLVSNLKKLTDTLNGKLTQQQVSDFRKSVESRLHVKLRDSVDKYNLRSFLYSGAISLKNVKLFFTENELKDVKLKLKNITFDTKNLNQLTFIYNAQSLNDRKMAANVESKIMLDADFTKKINEIKFNNLDEIFDFSYEKLANFYLSDLEKKQVEIKDLFTKKFENISGFFDYKISDAKISSNHKKISLIVDFLVGDLVVKSLTLSTKNTINFPDEFWKNLKIESSEFFKNSLFYEDPEAWKKAKKDRVLQFSQLANFNFWFVENIFNEAKKTFPNLENKVLDSEINLKLAGKNVNSLTNEEVDKIYQKITTDEKYWQKLLKISLPNGAKLTWEPFSPVYRFFVAGDNAIFKFKVTKSGKEKILLVNVNVEKDDEKSEDFQDFLEIRKIIEVENVPKNPLKSAEKLMSLIKIKENGKTHNKINSKDALFAFNNFYDLPKIGRYQIYAKDLISHENITNSTNGGTAKIFFWIKKDGVPIPFSILKTKLTEEEYKNKYTKMVYFFKPLNFDDITPQNSDWFRSSDFVSKSIEKADKELIDKINSKNFEYQRVNGAVLKKKAIKYALVDPVDIVEQKAFKELSFLLKLKKTEPNSDAKPNQFEALNNLKEEEITGKSVRNSTFFVSKENIFNPADASLNLNLNKIINDYFMYFYDVESKNSQSLTFRIGFINKKNPELRYSPDKKITLTNLKNDYKENLYPEIMLNMVGFSDFELKTTGTINIENLDELSKLITWKKPSIFYKNFQISTSDIKVADLKKDKENGNFFVKFKYTSPISKKVFTGNNWYKIKNIRANFAKKGLNFANKALQTVFDSENSVKRERQLELFFKDLLWDFDSKTQKATWILKNKYIEKTLLKPGSTSRKIKLNLFGNQLIQDDFRLKRIIEPDENLQFQFDFEKLIRGEKIKETRKTKFYHGINGKVHPQISFSLTVVYLENEGLKFEFELENKDFKIIFKNPYSEVLSFREIGGERFAEFKKEKAFLLNPAAAGVSVVYENSIQHEDFGEFTNRFDYKHLDFTQENQPILFYTPEEIINSNSYNPNQNVNYELHNGYLLDQEYGHADWKNVEVLNNAMARSFGYSRGTATELARLNDSPNDFRFYMITNRHVQGVKNFSDLSYEKLGSKTTGGYITKAAKNFENNIKNGFSYWNGLNHFSRPPIQVLWSGTNQFERKSVRKPAKDVDITVFVADLKSAIDQARSEGKFDLAQWFENWKTKPNLRLNFNWSQNGFFPMANTRKFAIVGFPYGKQANYYINRVLPGDGTTGLQVENGYVPAFFNAGNSGTGILGSNNEYIATINSGSPLTFLQGWNYDSTSTNFFGVNFKGEHPLDLENTNSLAAQIIRWHLKEPLNVDLPWFLRSFK
ncbi:MGA_1079 family surface serine endopeptidase [Mycoplasma sp. 'Moose RK']|uniref:MGA_1079 family surface serine endopeptidase n=1 Tax=Mycoplasma sp. 'Moose RK' TaxID=2780095 RepID=UPI0018C25400|nr:hypothetical protein [Mycoplasma sp. 'Moose RK']MBG0730965.1 hypothetical protein [Mycoplasma sp. 'Moose RK']